MTPTINNIEATRYLRDVPDNGRTLIVRGDAPNAGYEHLMITLYQCEKASLDDTLDDMCINHSGRREPELYNYMATLHSSRHDAEKAKLFDNISDLTMVVGLDVNGIEHERVDMKIAIDPAGGTSALFAVVAGLVLGYKRIYMCGVHLTPGTIWHDANVEKNWKTWEPVLRGKLAVYDHSGWLNKLFPKEL